MSDNNSEEFFPLNQEFLWRYMDFPKFLNLLSTSSLYFGSSNSFADRREGMAYSKELLPFYEAYASHRGKSANQRAINERQIALRPYYLISCWNIAASESVALWNMYTSGFNGVAIKTSKEVLANELKEAGKSFVARDMEYRNRALMNFPDNDPIEPFFSKTNEWAFEREHRVLIDMTKDPRFATAELRSQFNGLDLAHHVPVNLHRLIKDIKVHYKAPSFHLEDVRTLVAKFGLQQGLVSNSALVDSV